MLSGMSSAPIDCIQETAIAVTHLALPDVPSGLQKSINDLQPWMEKYFWGRHFPSFAGFHKSGEGHTKYPTWQSLVPFYHSEGGFPFEDGIFRLRLGWLLWIFDGTKPHSIQKNTWLSTCVAKKETGTAPVPPLNYDLQWVNYHYWALPSVGMWTSTVEKPDANTFYSYICRMICLGKIMYECSFNNPTGKNILSKKNMNEIYIYIFIYLYIYSISWV